MNAITVRLIDVARQRRGTWSYNRRPDNPNRKAVAALAKGEEPLDKTSVPYTD